MSISHFVIAYTTSGKKEVVMRLKDIREDRDFTQQQIAQVLHIKQNTYSQYESGKRQLPLEALVDLAQFYHVSTDYLLGLTEVSDPYPRKL